MTITEFSLFNETKTMPCDWIGQGYGYKDTEFDWDSGNPEHIIYIPEFGYRDGRGETVERKNAYSKNDFLDLVDGDNKLAREMFESVDWQFPETWLDEHEREIA